MDNNIGNKIRQLRESVKMSKEELAGKIFSTVQDIDLIESNEEIPSISIMAKISNVFGVRIGTILDGAEPLAPIVSKDNGLPHIKGGISINRDKHLPFSLAQGKSDRNMDPYIINVNYSKPDNGTVKSKHEGEEFIYVLDGKIVIYYGDQTYELNCGDSIYFDSIVPHHLSTKELDRSAKVLAIKYIP